MKLWTVTPPENAGKYRQWFWIMAMTVLFSANKLHAQGPCDQISFSKEDYGPCEFGMSYTTQTDCYIELRFILTSGEFATYTVNSADGFMVQQISPSELWITHEFGFIPTGFHVPLFFTLPHDLNTSMSVAYLNDCAQLGCEIIGGWPIESCPDPKDASIGGVKYRECESLPYIDQPTIPGWTIQAFDADGNVAGEAVTDADGNYRIYDLPKGHYIVRELPAPGWTPKVPASGEYLVDLGVSEQATRNFGNCPGCSCDSIYMDVVQVPGATDPCAYSLNVTNEGAYCFESILVTLSAGSFANVEPFNGWNLTQIDSQHLEFSPQNIDDWTQFVFHRWKVVGAAMYEVTSSATYNVGMGNVSCSRAFSFVCPPPMSPPPCCPAGSTFGPELTKNGDFELGNQDFTNDYTFFTPGGVSMIGKYSVLNQSQVYTANNQWSCTDHTTFSATGQMLIVDGYGGPVAWEQQVSVTAGTNYSFYAWFNNLVRPPKNHDDPQMALFVDNSQVAVSSVIAETPDQWIRLCGTWTATATGTVNLSIRMLATTSIGNDVGIDDISFRACIPQPPCQTSIQFTQNADCTVTVCAVTTGPQPVSYQWCDGRTDACFTTSQTPCVPTTYCVTATCADGTPSSANGSFTVTDNTPPVAVCNPGVGVDLDANCNYSVSTSFVDGGSTDNCGIQSMSVSPNVLTGCGDHMVTLTVTDWCGNTSTCSMGIQTIENVPPTAICYGGISVQLDANCLATIGVNDVDGGSTDNCQIASTSIDQSTFTQCGPQTVTLTVTDKCDNSATCTMPVNVVDNISPSLVCPPNTTLNASLPDCIASGNISFNPIFSDNCGISFQNYVATGATSNSGQGSVSGLSFNQGTTTVSYIIRDLCNNFAECTFVVTVLCPLDECDCPDNLVQNPGFSIGAVEGDLIGFGTSANWGVASGSPQVSNTTFCCDPFTIQMWGNEDLGESIRQSGFSFQPGKTYRIRFKARFLNQNLPTNYVRFGFTASNGSLDPFTCTTTCENMGETGNISNQVCDTYTLPDWTVASTTPWNTLIIRAFNNVPDQPGNANTISWGRIDNICITEVEDTCKCGAFSQLFARPTVGAPSIPLMCGGSYQFPCPAPGQSIPITGKFECEGDSCPPSTQVDWTLIDPQGTATNGSVSAGPYFFLPIMPLQYAIPGTYTLILKGNCGGVECPPCEIKFTVDCPNPCPCDVLQFQKDVAKGFATALWGNSCKGCFSPIALNDCDMVEWKINGGPTVANTNGSQSFCHTFPVAGTYTVTMIVTRKKSDGTLCEVFVFSKTVTVNCMLKLPCDESVFANPRFSQMAMAGGLNSGGASMKWKGLYGDPQVLEGAGTEDGWGIRLSGHIDAADVLSHDIAACFKKESGVLSIRQQIQSENQKADGRRDRRIAVFFNRSDNYVFNEFNPESCYRLAQLDITAYDTSWFDLEIPYDLSEWSALDTCGNNVVLIKPIIYAYTCFEASQGPETSNRIVMDHMCVDHSLVATKDPFYANQVRIAPNPTSAFFTVTLPAPARPGMRFRITDLAGRMLQELEIAPGTEQQTVQAGALPDGLYFLQVLENDRIIAVEKFVKQ